ncbi:ku p70 dna helicase, putative [Perkinsus marinus ATCC 50983]|uniref:Ku p70 dna helicase, putative n=1 Tax=Perkinsus marinus (strain ATCC 50983 / TXsc) TaxID=423536 RepID=C5LU28_PERM5|nr:ku p70 dna helicase, putative [Perkinsus marinus ATCC 50983]EEQ99826.1 ku p70 dna helicase, putative [Perkinsus marinus ATCC 50983]|eukprot:XP_002767109.1 ku p70 dna helicase, putative [Perkinsus marinus ATCC 50983]
MDVSTAADTADLAFNAETALKGDAFDHFDEVEDDSQKKSRDAVIFLLDVSNVDTLFTPEAPVAGDGQGLYGSGEASGRRTSCINNVLETLANLMRSKIIGRPEDMTGLILYNTAGADVNPMELAGVTVVQDLQQPSASRIREILDLAVTLDRAEFDRRWRKGPPSISPAFALHNAFWVASNIFQSHAAKGNIGRRVYVITNDDNPSGSPQERKAAEMKALDVGANDTDIDLAVLGINSSEEAQRFDVMKYWANVIPLPDEVEESRDPKKFLENTRGIMEDLATVIRRKEYKVRSLNRCNLTFAGAPDYVAAVQVYCHVKEAITPHPVYLHPESHKLLKSETRWINEDNGAMLDRDTEVRTYVDFGGEHVPITREDVVKMKSFKTDENDRDRSNMIAVPPLGGEGGQEGAEEEVISGSLEVIGFKSRRKLKFQHRIGHGYFLYPHEGRITGSKRLVEALCCRMAKREKVAFVRFVARANAQPIFGALSPQMPDEASQTSGGLVLLPLPFADDIRSLELPGTSVDEVISQEEQKQQIEAAKSIIRGFRISHWSPYSIDNPSLKLFYAGLEALALGGDLARDAVQDLLLPNERKGELAKDHVEAWKQTLGVDDLSSPPAKRPRAAEPFTMGLAVVRAKVLDGTLSRLTVSQLKDILREQRQSTNGKKQELIDRICHLV